MKYRELLLLPNWLILKLLRAKNVGCLKEWSKKILPYEYFFSSIFWIYILFTLLFLFINYLIFRNV